MVSDRGAGDVAKIGRPHLVLGFGNVLLSDDGVGVKLTEQLRLESGVAAARFIDGGTMSFSLLPLLEEASAVLVIDAANLDCPPGTVQLREGAEMDSFLQTKRRRSVHEVGLIDLLDMARLKGSLPHFRALLCIQPERIDWGADLSPSVRKALPNAAREARLLLDRWAGA